MLQDFADAMLAQAYAGSRPGSQATAKVFSDRQEQDLSINNTGKELKVHRFVIHNKLSYVWSEREINLSYVFN
jgi:hypothetical protein